MITKNPKIFLIIILILLSLYLFCTPSTFAVYTGDDSYTDNNNTIMIAYNTIGNDLLFRLDKFQDDSNMSFLLSLLNNPQYGYYLYYGDKDGLNMINGATYLQNNLNVAIYYLGDPYMSTTTYSNYQGMECNISLNRGIYYIFTFKDNEMEFSGGTGIYMPSILYNYKLDNVTNFLKNSVSNNSIIGALEDTTQAVDNTTSAVQSLENTINARDDNQVTNETSEVYSALTTSTSTQDSNSTSLFDFIKSFWTTIQNAIPSDNDVVSVTINLPFVTGGVTFRSDMLYNIIKNTLVYTLLQLCYYYTFGMYIVMGTWKLLLWLQQGEFTKGKPPIDVVMNHMLM